ncbi:MAG: sensor histidine kinase [Gaiellaceae bacterium]
MRDTDELRASRTRLALAADADRRELERELHDGVQQRLVALSVGLQLASRSADSDPAATKALLDELAGDVQLALDESARLAERIYPQVHGADGLAVALRAAAESVGARVSVDVDVDVAVPADLVTAVYWSCLEVLEQGSAATVAVRDEDGRLVFEVTATGLAGDLERVRDRVEALGGSVTIEPERLSGSLPLGA